MCCTKTSETNIIQDIFIPCFFVFASNGAFFDKFLGLNEMQTLLQSDNDLELFNLCIGDIDKDQFALLLLSKTRTYRIGSNGSRGFYLFVFGFLFTTFNPIYGFYLKVTFHRVLYVVSFDKAPGLFFITIIFRKQQTKSDQSKR